MISTEMHIANNIEDVADSGADIALSNIAAACIIAEGIENAGKTISDGIIESGQTIATAIRDSNMLLASKILSGTTVIANGLEKISSELERQTKFKELSSLKDRIREDENWLYEHKLIKKFYEQVKLEEKYISAIKPNIEAIPFLVTICKSRHIEHFSEFIINKEDNYNWETILQEYCLTNKCEPLRYLINLACKNGVVYCKAETPTYYTYYYEKNAIDLENNINNIKTFYIVGTGYSLKSEKFPGFMFQKEEKIGTVDIITEESYQVDGYEPTRQISAAVTKTNYKSTLTLEQAEELIENEIVLCKEEVICERDRLSWINFYQRLNSEIALDNLRTLANELEIYVRNTKIMEEIK